jgi:hypothetical protein
MDDKRCTLLPATVEKCMLLRLNRSLLPGFAKLSALQERRQENCQKIVALIRDTLAARNATTAVAQKQHVACGAAAAGSIAAAWLQRLPLLLLPMLLLARGACEGGYGNAGESARLRKRSHSHRSFHRSQATPPVPVPLPEPLPSTATF